MMDSIPNIEPKIFSIQRRKLANMQKGIIKHLKTILLERGLLLFLVGILLGRAVILSTVSPFAIAFLATIWTIHQKKARYMVIATLIGAISQSIIHSVFIILATVLFLILVNLFKKVKRHPIGIPLLVFITTGLSRLFIYSMTGVLSPYDWMLLLIEGILGSVLVLIFMQSIPLLSPGRYKPTLKNEEIVCIIILIASILTGTIGWEIYNVGIEQVLSRYFVLLLAFIGGAAIGSTVGVVAGLIMSLANVANLYQMSLLAFAGLLGGLLKEGKKLGVSVGLLVGTILVGIYGGTPTLVSSFIESSVAIVLFLLTPASWFKSLSRYIPGTEEHTQEQEQYLQKVRDVTAKRVEQFSDVFEALSESFTSSEAFTGADDQRQKETDYFLSEVTEKTCQKCFMKERCWQKEFDKTYSMMEKLKENLENGNEPNRNLFRTFSNHCVKTNKVIHTMKEEMAVFNINQQLKKQVIESKRLVADQLQGVSDIMDDFAKEILRERKHHEKQEAEITHALNNMGIDLERLDVYQLEKGNIDIEMTVAFYQYRGEGAKLIAPVLSDILKEMVIVKEEKPSPFPNGYTYLSFGSAKEYIVDTGVANAAKGGGLISGDSYTTIELGVGKYALAISDGMGNGKRAREESEETLKLLQQILQTGIPEHVAIKSINSILSLRTTDEMFATLDLAVINLHNASVRFLKIGSITSFIKRGNEVLTIEASNLPMGIIAEFDVDIVSKQLKSGDLLIMMSDGIFEGPQHIENIDAWFKRKIREMRTEHPQEVADLILEEVIRTSAGEIDDDMTVLVAKINKNIPRWSSVPVYKEKVVYQ